MGKILTATFLLCISTISPGQTILSGEFDSGLKLAYDSTTNKLSGYFENYSGLDEETGNPKFSCVFYMIGTVTDSIFTVDTYYPNDNDHKIKGYIRIINDRTLSVKLLEEHGGCWNVQHFADQQVKFSLEKHVEWTLIRYVTTDKAYYYADKAIDKKQKSFLVKNEFVCIDRIEGEWAFCTYFGKTATKGWVMTADLNKP